MKFTASGVANCAAIVRSPSFSRSSSSQTTTILPWRMSSSASSIVANGLRVFGLMALSISNPAFWAAAATPSGVVGPDRPWPDWDQPPPPWGAVTLTPIFRAPSASRSSNVRIAAPASCAASSTQQSGSLSRVSTRQRGKPRRRVGGQRQLGYGERPERCSGAIERSRADRAHEDLRMRDRADAEIVRVERQDAGHGAFVQCVRRPEERDQSAGVEDDHSGQSSRSSSR